jgi:anaphase-promoting complex subunit 10
VDEEEEDDSEEGEEEANLTANEEDVDAGGANATNAAGNDGAPGGGRNEDEVTNEDQQPATTGRDDEDDEEARRQREREQQQHDATNNREAQDAEDRADTFHDKAYAARRNVREIGDEAVWSVTSAKPGNGVELLRDGNLKTYWQSDGAQPHFINCQFQKKANVCEVAIYTNYKQDESYTPSKIVIRAGNSYRDLKDVATKTLNEPHGWQRVRTTRLDKEKLKDIHAQYGSKKHLKNSGLEYLEKESCEAPIRAFFIQICILQNHQNGRDTHVRQVHVYSPAATPASDGPRARFQSSEYARYAVVR